MQVDCRLGIRKSALTALFSFWLAGCLPDGSGGQGAQGPTSSNPGSTSGNPGSTGTPPPTPPPPGSIDTSNAEPAAMYSVQSDLTHRAPLDESLQDQQLVYFFLEPSADWERRGVAEVSHVCCKGIGGPAGGTPHGTRIATTQQPWSLPFDLSTLQGNSTWEAEMRVSFRDGSPAAVIRSQFLLQADDSGAAATPGPSTPPPPPLTPDPGGSSQTPATPSTPSTPSTPTQPQNSPPNISGSAPRESVVGRTYSFTPAANDPDGDTVAFSVSNQPGWLNFDSLTGELSGTPTINDVGVYRDITLFASDGKATSALPAFAIEVSSNATGSVSLSWMPPTRRVNGNALGNVSGYRLYFGQDSASYTDQILLEGGGLTTYTVENLTQGTWYFAITALDSSGIESDLSREAVARVR